MNETPAGGMVSIVESVDAALIRAAIDALLRGGRDAEIAAETGLPGLRDRSADEALN